MRALRHNITGILLAGGRSRRMGRDKGMIRLGKFLMYQYPLKVLESLCDEILISTCNPMEIEKDYEQVCDNIPGIGPIGGVVTCLEKSSNDLNIIVSYDLPLVNRELFIELLKYAGETDGSATDSLHGRNTSTLQPGMNPADDPLQANRVIQPNIYDVILPAATPGRPEPLCGIYRKSTAMILQQMIGQNIYAIHKLVTRANAKIVNIDGSQSFFHDHLFKNVNSESDLSGLPGHLL
ncbi:MAG: molybdenum cofactor guanylyltransferase [Bacteroidales bacterium]|nr:molybdenum cofactor guanylyltransferase [Bacteroidales bacterium]